MFWLRNLLRATTPHSFYNSWTPKSAPTIRRFGPSYFEMCPAPPVNCLDCSGRQVLLVSWLPKLPHATTACNFGFLIPSRGSAPAALVSVLFDPLGQRNRGKAQCLATFLPFRSPWSSFYWLFLFSGCFCCICPEVRSLTSKLPSITSSCLNSKTLPSG